MILNIPLLATALGGLFVGKTMHDAQHPKPARRPSRRRQELAKRNLENAGSQALVNLFSDARQGHLQRLSRGGSALAVIDPQQAEAGRRVRVASVNLVVAIGGVFYPILYFATIPMFAYLLIPILLQALRELIHERKVSLCFLDSVFLSGALLGRFFSAVAAGAWLIEVGNYLLIKSEHRSREKLTNIFGEQPRSVWVLVDDTEMEIPFESLTPDDVVVVHAGQTVPVDGEIIEGTVSIDQHMLTGESQPVEKGVGDTVMASTNLIAGRMHVRVQKTGEETIVAQLGKILDSTSEYSEQLQSRGDRIAHKAVIPTLLLGAVGYPIVGLRGALTLLTASFGYNLRVVSPISMLNFLQIASQRGVLIKDGRSLETLSQIDTLVFDKTGTLTLDQPTVCGLHSCSRRSGEEILRYAATAEQKQTHPIARAILAAAQAESLNFIPVEDTRYDIGYGITVVLKDMQVRVGSRRFMDMHQIKIPSTIKAVQERCEQSGHSLVYVAFNDALGGAIELQPTIRPEAREVISQLKRRNMDMYIISGDHEEPTRKLAQDLGIERYFAETLPENKADLVAQLQKEGRRVCFVGDGINDSIALKTADVSVSLLGATTIATDTAQIVFMDESLRELQFLFEFGDSFKKTMDRALLSTVIPGVICIGGVFFLRFGIFTGIALFNLGLISGIANATVPKLRYDAQLAKEQQAKALAEDLADSQQADTEAVDPA